MGPSLRIDRVEIAVGIEDAEYKALGNNYTYFIGCILFPLINIAPITRIFCTNLTKVFFFLARPTWFMILCIKTLIKI